jgi:hypothetical protein
MEPERLVVDVVRADAVRVGDEVLIVELHDKVKDVHNYAGYSWLTLASDEGAQLGNGSRVLRVVPASAEPSHEQVEATRLRFALSAIAAALARFGSPGGRASDLDQAHRFATTALAGSAPPDWAPEQTEAAQAVLDAYDDWSVNSFPTVGTPQRSANAWFREAQQVEQAIEALRSAVSHPVGEEVPPLDETGLCWASGPCDCGKQHKGVSVSPPQEDT